MSADGDHQDTSNPEHLSQQPAQGNGARLPLPGPGDGAQVVCSIPIANVLQRRECGCWHWHQETLVVAVQERRVGHD